MKQTWNTKRWEVFAGIIVWVFILSFVIIGITKLMTYNSENQSVYMQENDIISLKESGLAIISKLDTSLIQDSEVFYLEKDNINKTFIIHTWSLNNTYQYVNSQWSSVWDPDDHFSYVYKRSFTLHTFSHSLWWNSSKITTTVEPYIAQ